MSETKSNLDEFIGKYRVVELLGRGGMAEVYKAYHEGLDRHVAIKLMHSFLAEDPDFLGRFQREARAMAALNHPNIVNVYDFVYEEDLYYIVMEFLPGLSLKEVLEAYSLRGDSLSLAMAVRIVLEVGDALAYAHSRGMVHRDIKPANIMTRKDGAAVLTDFGIAKILSGPSHTATGAMIGTPAYMSPEQALGQAGDERSDLYALGILCFQLVTGRLPFAADTPLAVVLMHVNEAVPQPTSFNPDVPEAIQDVILKATAKDPDERFQTGHEFAQALRGAVRQEGIDLAQALPAELMEDRPTPPPMDTMSAATKLEDASEKTRLSQEAPTRLVRRSAAAAAPTIVQRPKPKPAEAPVEVPVIEPTGSGRRRIFFIIGGVLLLMILLAGGAFAVSMMGSDQEPTATTTLGVVAEAETATPTQPAATATATTVLPTVTEAPTADLVQTVLAAQVATADAMPTDTATPTPTQTPTSTSTPDLTATFVAGCEPDVTLENYYTYNDEDVQSAPISSNFPLRLELENSGTCEWAETFFVEFLEGEDFQVEGPVELEEPLAAGESRVVTLDLRAPGTPGQRAGTWVLRDGSGEQIGEPFEVSILIFTSATATSAPPAATATSAAPTATTAPEQEINFAFEVKWCEYSGDNWRCNLEITPYGGVGPPYTLNFPDLDPGYNGVGTGPFSYIIIERRCGAWAHNIRIQDDAGNVINVDRHFSPNSEPVASLLPSACTEP